MRPSNIISFRASLCFVLGCLASRTYAYFMITEPSTTSIWQNGVPNVISWTKGLLDNIHAVDIELARLSTDGLIFVAKDAPAAPGHALNIFLQDVPPADDYFVLFLNSTHGFMYATSSRFTILPASASIPANVTHSSPDPAVPTVTVSGGPNPMKAFQTTFPPSANGVRALSWNDDSFSRQLLCMLSVLAASLFGAAWTIW